MAKLEGAQEVIASTAAYLATLSEDARKLMLEIIEAQAEAIAAQDAQGYEPKAVRQKREKTEKKARKPRSDAGKKRGPRKKLKEQEEEETEEPEEPQDQEEDDSDEAPGAGISDDEAVSSASMRGQRL